LFSPFYHKIGRESRAYRRKIQKHFLLSIKKHLEAGNTKAVLEIIDQMIKHIEKQKRLATATKQTANLTPQQGRAESLTSAALHYNTVRQESQ
jgi:hypothetical protein